MRSQVGTAKRPLLPSIFVLQDTVHHTEADRAFAAGHVLAGESRITRQEELITRLKAKGLSTIGAEAVLATMLVTLDHMRDHLAQIEADLQE